MLLLRSKPRRQRDCEQSRFVKPAKASRTCATPSLIRGSGETGRHGRRRKSGAAAPANRLNGNPLNILQWAHRNGCAWDELTCARAAQSGNLEVLRWTHENGCHWDELTCLRAAEKAQEKSPESIRVLEWLVSSPDDPCHGDICGEAIRKTLHEEQSSCSRSVLGDR